MSWSRLILILVGLFAVLNSVAQTTTNTPAPLVWGDNLPAGRIKSGKEKKPLLLFIASANSADSQRLEETTFTDPLVVEELSNWVLVRIEFEKNQFFCKSVGVSRAPMILSAPPGSITGLYGTATTEPGPDGVAKTTFITFDPRAFVDERKFDRRSMHLIK